MSTENDRMIRRLERKIKSGELYDAHQLVGAIFDRFVKTSKVDEGLEFAETYAEKFSQNEGYELTVNLGKRSLELLQSTNTKPSLELLDKLSMFYLLCPPLSTDTKHHYMKALIKWSKALPQNDEFQQKHGARNLHILIAQAYIAEKNFGAAQGHAVLSGDIQTIQDLLNEWKEAVYPTEQLLLHTRVVMILLGLKDIDTAGKLLEQFSEVEWNSPNVPPPLQMAYLLYIACKERNNKLLDFITRKYALVIRLDPSFDTAISAIETNIFNIKQQPTGIMGMLNSLFGQSPPIAASH